MPGLMRRRRSLERWKIAGRMPVVSLASVSYFQILRFHILIMKKAPGIEPDLDDSAKASIIFSLFGAVGFTRRMVEHFGSSKCLRTYSAERNPSVSANCNALLSILLDSEEYPMKIAIVEKVTTFICDNWWDSCGSLDDKWV